MYIAEIHKLAYLASNVAKISQTRPNNRSFWNNRTPISLPCLKCKAGNKSGKSKDFGSISQLCRHIARQHQFDSQQKPTTDDYLILLQALAVLLDSLDSTNNDHLTLLRVFSSLSEMGGIYLD